MSDRFVNSLRPVSANASQMTDRKVERNGTTYTQNTANIGRKPEHTAFARIREDSRGFASPGHSVYSG